MKKVSLALAFLAVVSCRFDQTGNKNIIPERDGAHHEVEHHEENHEGAEDIHADNATPKSSELDASGNYIYNVGDLIDINLPDGTVLHIGQNSTENKLFTMLQDAGFTVNTDKSQDWVTLDRVYFNTGSDELTANSKVQLDNIAKILTAFPTAEVKLGGYTDNTGSQEINQPLSEGRAKSVLNDISNAGIAANRLSSEGYGSEHPICPANDTDICKAQNRRVDIRITKK